MREPLPSQRPLAYLACQGATFGTSCGRGSSGAGRSALAPKPLVSVTVPTLNSESVIAGCLASVKGQSYPNIETIIVDSLSTDRTREIAASNGVIVITYEGRLLGARYQGVLQSKGQYVLLLDSDQILEATAIERAIPLMAEYDLLVLEELSYEPESWLQKLFSADKQLVHRNVDDRALDPLAATLLPRFFRRDILLRGLENIPRELIPLVVYPDHDIIYFETRRITSRVGILPTAVYHHEPASVAAAWKKHFRYGRSLRELGESRRYKELAQRNWGFRKCGFRPGNLRLSLQSLFLLTLVGIARTAGYWLGGRLAPLPGSPQKPVS